MMCLSRQPDFRTLERQTAFTLIELLAAIGIIAVLISLLMPALGHARELSKRTSCTVHLREIGEATFFYLQQEKEGFPPLNNEPSDGHWQYNYVIWDGRDFNSNFGALVSKNLLPDMRSLYCPTQRSAYHMQNTFVNPWPQRPNMDSRAAYGRRMNISGLDLTRIKPATAIYADLSHTAEYVQSGHATGVNVEFADGHVRFVPKFDLLVRNEMALPTSILDNPVMEKIWEQLDLRE